MAEMRDLLIDWPSILITVFLGLSLGRMKDVHGCLVPAEASRAIFSFFTIIRVRENAAILENKETFLTNSLKGISILGSV